MSSPHPEGADALEQPTAAGGSDSPLDDVPAAGDVPQDVENNDGDETQDGVVHKADPVSSGSRGHEEEQVEQYDDEDQPVLNEKECKSLIYWYINSPTDSYVLSSEPGQGQRCH